VPAFCGSEGNGAHPFVTPSDVPEGHKDVERVTDRIGIIGGRELGAALARTVARAGIEAVLGGHWERAPANGGRNAAAAAARLRKAAEEEIVFLAVPWPQVAEVLSTLPDWEGRILIDATDPTAADLVAAGLGGGSSSEIVSGLAPGAQLVKAFGTLPPHIVEADPCQGGGRRVIFFSGDHRRAKREVARLIMRLGFAGVDLGGLAEGTRLQQFPDGPLRGLNLIKIE
jgi:8-hydroxy-5-deazaflavin:NADPH oxidoreductase